MSRWASDGVGDGAALVGLGRPAMLALVKAGTFSVVKPASLIRREPGVVGEGQAARVVVGPGEVVHLPAIEREEPPPTLAVDRVGEADRGELG